MSTWATVFNLLMSTFTIHLKSLTPPSFLVSIVSVVPRLCRPSFLSSVAPVAFASVEWRSCLIGDIALVIASGSHNEADDPIFVHGKIKNEVISRTGDGPSFPTPGSASGAGLHRETHNHDQDEKRQDSPASIPM